MQNCVIKVVEKNLLKILDIYNINSNKFNLHVSSVLCSKSGAILLILSFFLLDKIKFTDFFLIELKAN